MKANDPAREGEAGDCLLAGDGHGYSATRTSHQFLTEPYGDREEAAFDLLIAFRAGRLALTRNAASFVGESLVDPTPLTEKQAAWFDKLLVKASLPPMAEGAV